MNTKSQSALENLMLWGVIFIGLGALFYGSIGYININYRTSQTEDSLRSVAITANAIYNLGPGSREVISIEMPEGVTQTEVSGKAINAKITGFAGVEEDVYVNTIPDIIGSIPPGIGRRDVSIKVLNESLVRIGNGVAIFSLSPNPVPSASIPLTVTLFGDEFVNGVAILVDGNVFGIATYIDENYISFKTLPAAAFTPGVYKISVQNPNGDFSNEVNLIVTP